MGSARTGGGTSGLGGIPTTLAEPAMGEPRQLALRLAEPPERGVPRRTEVLPDVVHVPDWLDLDAQRALVDEFRRGPLPPAGLRHPRVPTGQLMSVQSVCLGWHWTRTCTRARPTTPTARR